MHYYGYSERPLDRVIVATTQRKRPVTIEGLTYRFVTLQLYKFFGYEPIRLLDRAVQIAGREKAIADGFDHTRLAGGVLEAAKGLWFGKHELDWEKLVAYTLRLQNQVAARRLGFWLEQLELGDAHFRLEDGSGNSYARLEPSGPRDGPRYAAVPRQALHSRPRPNPSQR